MSHDHELITELRQARKALSLAKIAEIDARATRKKAELAFEELMAQIETGQSGRKDSPLLDHIVARGGGRPEEEEPEPADERQRGPTVREPRIADHQAVPPAPRKRGRPHKLQAAERAEPGRPGPLESWAREHGMDSMTIESAARTDRVKVDDQADADEPPAAMEWTSADLERVLLGSLNLTSTLYPKAPWLDLKKTGCDDRKILEVLRSIWPYGYTVLPIGCTIHGGPTPAFWIGVRKSPDWKIAPPQLQGLQLADRVRRVLGIPRARTEPQTETTADRQPVRQRRRKAAAHAEAGA